MKTSLHASVAEVVVVHIELQTKQVFFPHGSHLPVLLVLGRAALTR